MYMLDYQEYIYQNQKPNLYPVKYNLNNQKERVIPLSFSLIYNHNILMNNL